MLAKITSKNQITLPKAVIREYPGARYFEVQSGDGRIVLTPVRIGRADAVRDKLAALGITEADAGAAVKWARSRKPR